MPLAFSLLLRWLPLAVLAFAAFWLRTYDLARRPMHADEANQAVKLGELLDQGHYAFDPRDHHGPTLYYAAVPIAWLRREKSLAALTESTVRLVPALFGTVSVLLVAALAAPLGRWPAFAATLFFALAPPSIYYSRYFIQETLLLTFTLATFLAFRTWWRTGLMRWAILAGATLGLMQATKASAPLFLALGALALWATHGELRAASRRPRRDLGVALLAAVATAALLYSSFGTNLSGVRDALAAYSHAFTRFGSASPPTGHEKPWWYYLRIFGWHREGGVVWHQAGLSALAVAGLAVALIRRDPFVRGVALYATGVAIAFSAFAYKTPWHAVHFVPGFAVLAAVALAAIGRLRTGRIVATAFAAVVAVTLLGQAKRAAFQRPADQRNPYAYVHSSTDVLKYRALAETARAAKPGAPIRVISEEYWPLPWYLRGVSQVGYYTTPPEDCDGALVIASNSQAEAVRARLRGSYRETFLGLRPGFICVIFIAEP